MIRKLRADIMPPPGARRPAGDTLMLLVQTMENVIDKAASTPNPGPRGFQRLNRPEYERVVHDLLGVNINAADYLPLDTKSANFDNIADAQALSPTLLDGYLNAAGAVARMAVGDRKAAPAVTTYRSSPFVVAAPVGSSRRRAVRHARRHRQRAQLSGRRPLLLPDQHLGRRRHEARGRRRLGERPAGCPAPLREGRGAGQRLGRHATGPRQLPHRADRDQGGTAEGLGVVRAPLRGAVRRPDQAERVVAGVERHGQRRQSRRRRTSSSSRSSVRRRSPASPRPRAASSSSAAIPRRPPTAPRAPTRSSRGWPLGATAGRSPRTTARG